MERLSIIVFTVHSRVKDTIMILTVGLVRPAPEGAESGADYDIPELNESKEDIKLHMVEGSRFDPNRSLEETKFDPNRFFEDARFDPNRSFDDTRFDPNLSVDSVESRMLDISEDSLNIPKLGDSSFDRDSIVEEEEAGQDAPVIHKEGERTIIMSPGLVANAESRVYISSSSWINIESGSGFVSSTDIGGPEEPVKPPRLKKIARQQSKQELLRAKGFGLTPKPDDEPEPRPDKTKVRPEISSPILINSTLNPLDLESHKCIPLTGLERVLQESVYRAGFSDSDSSFYTLESFLDETYLSQSSASDTYTDHIYEEIQENRLRVRPLPPIPEGHAGSKSGSIFTGATKSEILHFLNDARLRIGGNGFSGELDSVLEEHYSPEGVFLGVRNNKHRISAISNISDSSSSSNDSCGDGSVLWRGPLEKLAGTVDIERNDSGVGSDSGLSSSKLSTAEPGLQTCGDCDTVLGDEENLCSKCNKRRTERKEIISEIVETEIKYGNDLGIIVDEFYRPMLGTVH